MGFFSSLFGSGESGGGGKGKNIANVKKRFDLQNRTGQGSMSKVYRAYDRELGRVICLKLLDKEKTKKFEERFSAQKLKKPTEGQICLELKHKNIVVTYEHGVTTDGEPYLVMEYIDGLGLNYLIETNNVQLKGNRINYVAQLCDAVQYLHQQKYIHRDLCPRNIMVTNDGVVKLIDFGLTIPYTPSFTQPGNRTGTVDYLAPEIIKRMATDHRVDMFALGVTAYEIFTGQMPWERTVSSEETLRRRLNTLPRDAKLMNPELDDEVVAVLMKSIERDRALRYNSAQQFKESLERLDNQSY
ncbi:MAG: serine/threonine protein kinase [Bacteroidales bacterium]|nr:serine/threonine protein kinase [Bacteroidales bacterium]